MEDGSLQARYRRLLSFGDVLDESIQLYRQHWAQFALISAVGLVPPGLLLIWLSVAGAITRTVTLADLRDGSIDQSTYLTQALALLASSVVSGLFALIWTAAIVVTADTLLRGRRPEVVGVYVPALRRLPVLLVASLVYLVAMLGWLLVGTALFVLTGFGTLGSLIAGVAFLVWWLRPGARKRWLKWLIILTAPFGVAVYASIRWSMLVTAVMLEARGPISALARSSQLVHGHWLRVASVLTVGSLLVGVLLSTPSALVNIPLAVSDAARGQYGLSPVEAAISNAVSVAVQVLFASIGPIIYTLTFSDLRNRREGTDIAERLNQLEGSAVLANG